MHLGTWKSRDEEKRQLRVKVATLDRALDAQRKARARLAKERDSLKRENKELSQRVKKLESRCKELEQQRDRYRAMTFKPNVKKSTEETSGHGEVDADILKLLKKKRKRGAQKGHPGQGRKTPERVDEVQQAYLEKCPDCGEPLDHSNTIDKHTVEDIPPVEEQRSKVTRYETEVQWCRKCRKIVKAKLFDVLPKARLGINALLYVFIHKYIARSTWDTIVWSLAYWYGIQISKGALVGMMHRARKWLEKRYGQILEQIRASPVKHADETGWRVDGSNHWLWGFFTNQQAYYTVEESRGKGVPQKILNGSHPNDVLVRDDYGAYSKLLLKHQSCWTHLLRKSREAAHATGASTEVRRLHRKLKRMYVALQKIINQPFKLTKRQKAYDRFDKKLQYIIDSEYCYQDTKEIQTRIANQGTNLLTALLYDNVPLTNNLAERGIRPMVVTRKISGGSRSWEGAKTHAVHMSILQTIRLQQQPFVPTLKNYLLSTLQN